MASSSQAASRAKCAVGRYVADRRSSDSTDRSTIARSNAATLERGASSIWMISALVSARRSFSKASSTPTIRATDWLTDCETMILNPYI